MFSVREDEQSYAILAKVETPEANRYGTKIQLVDENSELAGKSLNINGDSGIGTNPDRYKQHGFYFNADNCIACHACESACSEKNDLPPHLAYRAVGYVEGGTWPAYRRLNISMACNHCDDPVCLKGCPTRAYTKFAEYGAVLQDPDICFGCGYCTWVCPYNAPQLDVEAGHVQKCNMCVDRLEVGLKPACVSACLAGALDFGVTETTPENRDQLETQIPGFPSPDITHPNIRFQQKRSLPREMSRTDSMPLKYERDEQGQGAYHAKVDKNKYTGQRQWNLKKLRSREDPLVIFTLVSQMVIGAFLVLFLGPKLGLTVLTQEAHPLVHAVLLLVLLGLETFALVLSTMHLGRPHRFYRAFNNLRYSPVSREVAGIAVFFNMLGAYTLLSIIPGLSDFLSPTLVYSLQQLVGWGAVVSGPVAIYFMCSIYRIKARPFWDHWQVVTSFYGTMFALGSLLIGLVYAAVLLLEGKDFLVLMETLAIPLIFGLFIESIGLIIHARDLTRKGGEGAASHYEQCTRYGKTYILRNIGLLLGLVLALFMASTGLGAALGYGGWFLVGMLVTASAIIGRALFYVLVIPTTMPGAFFWRNRGFEEHARETGLAQMPQVGVVANTH